MMNKTDGITYKKPVYIAWKFGFIETNHYAQHNKALRMRSAIRRAVKRGLLKRDNTTPPSRTRYHLTEAGRFVMEKHWHM